MSKTTTASALFRVWVRLHDRPLTFRQMLPMRRQAGRFVRELPD